MVTPTRNPEKFPLTNPKDDAAAELLIREVDEDLRQESLERLWKKYGPLMLGGALVVVVVVAGVQGWNNWRHDERLKSSLRYSDATAALRGDDAAKVKGLEELEHLAAEGSSGYRLLAQFKLAERAQARGDGAEAAALYDQVVAMSGVETHYRDLALLKSAYLKVEAGQIETVEKAVTPLAAEASPWRHSAREVLALVALRRGDQAKALEWLRKVADDAAAPNAIRGRAAEMLAAVQASVSG